MVTELHRGNTDRHANDVTLEPIWLPHWPACRCTISLMSVRPHTTHASLLLTANTAPGSLYQPSDWKEKGARLSRDCNGFESYYQLLKAVSVLIAGISILLRCYGASLSKSWPRKPSLTPSVRYFLQFLLEITGQCRVSEKTLWVCVQKLLHCAGSLKAIHVQVVCYLLLLHLQGQTLLYLHDKSPSYPFIHCDVHPNPYPTS
jgi:hypothetical protein